MWHDVAHVAVNRDMATGFPSRLSHRLDGLLGRLSGLERHSHSTEIPRLDQRSTPEHRCRERSPTTISVPMT